MPATSEARIAANRKNALRSTGPRTPEGKERSRRNGLKHGLSGRGVVLSEGDRSEVELRTAALLAELAPASTLGAILVGQIATLSCRMERAARREEAATLARVRHSGETFDQIRSDQADGLFQAMIGVGVDDPRVAYRQLRASVHGVDRLLQGWDDLRADLTRPGRAFWNRPNLVRGAILAGLRVVDVEGSSVGELSKLAWGGIPGRFDDEPEGLDLDARRLWAVDRLVEWVDGEIADLTAHLETFDLEAIALDRSAAAELALFDPSREAMLAVRYESEARRGFFKALKEFRQVEAEAEAVEVEMEAEDHPPEIEPVDPPLGSCREEASARGRGSRSSPTERFTGRVRPSLGGDGAAEGLDGRVPAVGRAGFGVG